MRCGAVLLMLSLPALAFGQRGFWPRAEGSHTPISSSTPGAEATDLLARKLSEAELPDYLKQLLRNNGNMDNATAQKLLQSPFAADILKRLADGDPALMKLVEQYAANRPELRGMSADKIRELISDRAKNLINPGEGVSAVNKDLIKNLLREPTAAERETLARQAYSERLSDAVRELKMDGMLEQLRDSPAFNNWMKALGKSGNLTSGPLTLGDTRHFFGGMDNFLKRLRHYLPKDVPSLRNLNISPPATPTMSLPSFGLGRFAGTWWDLSGNWPTAMVLVLVGLIVTLALLRARQVRLRPAVVRTNLGPWPVDPNAVSTRNELIAAFEYLALLKCGSDAIHWHHHAVARDWGRNPEVRRDAESLASLYEQARYAPADRPGIWESSRSLLKRIAGGTA